MVLRHLTAIGCAALLCCLALLIAGPSLPALADVAEEQDEVGVWKCMTRRYGTCPPDGLGRAPEEFWTYAFFAQWRKIRVSNCKIIDSTRNTISASTRAAYEQCVGSYYPLITKVIYESYFYSELFCPEGFISRQGQCVEVERPRSDDDCQQPAGSPADAATGGYRGSVTDAMIAGGSGPNVQKMAVPDDRPLELTRYYSSQHPGLTGSIQSRLGVGWRTGFDAEASWAGELSTTKLIHVVLPDFSDHSFAFIDGAWKQVLPRLGSSTVVWDRLRSGAGETLALTGAGLTLRRADGTRYVFNPAGKLSQIVFADSYTQTLTYAGDLNTRVTDNRGRWLNFIHAPAGSAWAGLLLVAQGSDGKLVRYGYDDRSLAGLDPKMKEKTTGQGQWALRLVSSPSTTPSQGYVPATTYEYLDNRYRPYLITTVTNKPSPEPSTWSTTTWTYDVKKRVTSVERSPGRGRWEYRYDDAEQQVAVTDPQGRQMLYSRQVGSDGLTRVSLLGMSVARPRSTVAPLPKSPRSIIDDLLCWLGQGCPPDSCPIDGEERCKIVKSHCFRSCDFTLDNAALQDLQSMYFNRCVLQCRFDFMCEGTDYPNDGWDQGKLGTPRPWLDIGRLLNGKTIRRLQ